MIACRRWVRAVVLLSLAAAALGVVGAEAWAWPWTQNKADYLDLGDVMKSPQAFLGRTIRFKCRFALRGNLYKDFNTRFNSAEHANFAVWPLESQLWDTAERRNVLPTLYVDKSKAANLRVLNDVKRYDVVDVKGQVVSAYSGLPWVLVDEIKKLDLEDQVLTDRALKHIRLGSDLVDQGKGEIAARHLEMVLEAGVAKDHKVFVLRTLGKAHKIAGNLAAAETRLEEAIELKDDAPETHLLLAEVRLAREDASGVIASCKRVLDLTADHPEVHGLMGEAYGMQGQIDKALEQCDLAAAVPGLSLEEGGMVEIRRARVLVAAHRYADAVRAYAQAIRQDNPLASEPWVRKEIGRLYESRYDATGDRKNLQEAMREYTNANVLSNNQDPEGLFLAARAAYKEAKAAEAGAFGKAKELLERCVSVDRHYLPARVLRGKIALSEGNSEEAKQIFEELVQNGARNADTLLALAGVYEDMGLKAEAKDAYGQVVELVPDNRKALEHHAQLAEELGDLAAAKSSLAALVDLAPKDSAYAMRLGRLYFRTGDYATAAQVLQTAAEAPGAQGEAAGILLGRARALGGDGAGAEAALRAVLKENPRNTEAMGRLAMLLADQGKKSAEALDLALRAYAKEQGNPMYADILAWAQVQAGQPDKAVETLEGIPADRRGRLAWYHLAVARYESGDLAGARQAAQSAAAPAAEGELEPVVRAVQARVKALLEAIDKAEQAPQPEARLLKNEQARHKDGAEPAAADEPQNAVEAKADAIRDRLEKIDVSEQSEPSPAPSTSEAVPPADETEPPSQPATDVKPKFQADRRPARDDVAEIWTRDPRPAEPQKPAPASKRETPTARQDKGTVEIPGVVEPDFGTDISTLAGPEKPAINTVRDLPALPDTRVTESVAPAEIELPAKPAEAESQPVAESNANEAPAPSIEVEWEDAPVASDTEKKSAPVAEPEQDQGLPKNSVNGLPDWAK